MKALVTGGMAGLGAAIVARLRADGLDVVVVDRAPDADVQVDLGRDPIPVFPDVDVCVSAAGRATVAPVRHMLVEEWERDVAVNLTGAFRVVQACLEGMRERRFGRIVVISSAAARTGVPGQVAFAAAKAGLLGMVKTIAAEEAPRGITCNAVLPGLVATAWVRRIPAASRAQMLEAIPTGRFVEPHEVASLVAWLCSDAAGQVTGQELIMDGGMELNTTGVSTALRA